MDIPVRFFFWHDFRKHYNKPSIMKYLSILALALIIFSCKVGEEIVEAQDQVEDVAETVEDTRVIGLVHTSPTGCPYFIEAKTDDGPLKMYPINLEDKFKVDGLRLKFNYNVVKASQPAGCDTDIAVELIEPTAYR